VLQPVKSNNHTRDETDIVKDEVADDEMEGEDKKEEEADEV
jgi:hypothetical protein